MAWRCKRAQVPSAMGKVEAAVVAGQVPGSGRDTWTACLHRVKSEPQRSIYALRLAMASRLASTVAWTALELSLVSKTEGTLTLPGPSRSAGKVPEAFIGKRKISD